MESEPSSVEVDPRRDCKVSEDGLSVELVCATYTWLQYL